MKKTQRIFLYGTLKQGQYFHEKYIGGDKSSFVSHAMTSPDYTMYIVHGLPHLVKERTGVACKGELYLVDEKVLKTLDGLEEPAYFRELIEVFGENNERLLAWAYLRPKNFSGKAQGWSEAEFV